MRTKVFELNDFPRFASPSIDGIRVPDTARSLGQRLAEKSFMSYGSLWPRLDHIVRHGISETYLLANFSFYTEGWKNRALQSAAREVSTLMGRKGTWYRLSKDTRTVSGFVFKTSIRGVWFDGLQAYAVLINPRKSQRLSQVDVAFLARGIYELYCIDDPNDPKPMIIDLSADDTGNRNPVCHTVDELEFMPLGLFEDIIRKFLDAMAAAGVSNPVPADQHIVDLLRGRSR